MYLYIERVSTWETHYYGVNERGTYRLMTMSLYRVIIVSRASDILLVGRWREGEGGQGETMLSEGEGRRVILEEGSMRRSSCVEE